MRVFISWSGEPAMRIAEALKFFLDNVLTGRATTFVSSQDIQKGARGGAVLTQELGVTDYGLLVLTSLNQSAPWVLFEAGALSKSLDSGQVVPLMVDIEQVQPTSPLAQFQRTSLRDEEDVSRLLHEMNERLPDSISLRSLGTLFRAEWSALANVIEEAVKSLEQPAPPVTDTTLLQAILDEVRGVAGQSRRLASRVTSLEQAAAPSQAAGPGRRFINPGLLAEVEALERGLNGPHRGVAAALAKNIEDLEPAVVDRGRRRVGDVAAAAVLLAEQEEAERRRRITRAKRDAIRQATEDPGEKA